MGCCSSKEDVVPDGSGGVVPTKTRKCRDVLCCVIFVVFWLGMVVLAIVGVANGTPQSLLYGTDFNGTVCGNGAVADSKYIFYPRMNEDMQVQAAKGIQPLSMKFYGLCVNRCPEMGDYICTYAAEAQIRSSNPNANATTLMAKRQARASSSLFGSADCWLVSLPSEAVAFRCLPMQVTTSNSTEMCLAPADAPQYYTTTANGIKVPNANCTVKVTLTTSQTIGEANSNPVLDSLQTTTALVGRYLSDIQKTFGELLAGGGGGAFILGWIFLILMRFCAGCIIWFVLFATIILLGILSVFFLVKGGLIRSDQVDQITTAIQTATTLGVQVPASLTQSQSNTKVFQAAAVISIFFTVVALLVVCFMRKRIKIAIGIIREASRAIQRLPFLVLFPVFPVVAIIVLFIYATIIGAYIYSANGQTTTTQADLQWVNQLNASSANVTPNQLMKIMVAYHFFGFLWTNQVIQSVSMTTIAGAVCKYYWSRDKKKIGRFPILASFLDCFRYHFGSLALGSFIIALVQFIRAVLLYVDRRTKQLQQSNLAVKVALKVVACCLWCLEKCLKFISKNAYILIAMKGRSFCASTREAFALIFANMAQIAVATAIVNLILVVARVAISIAAAIILFLYFDKNSQFDTGGSRELSSLFPPVVLGFLLAWFVSGAFLGVYEMTVDTILLCFCEDRRINHESGQYYMSNELAAFVDKASKKSKPADGDKSVPSTPASPGTKTIEVSSRAKPEEI
ncbi:hypothetical protein AeNC1_000862 [Aphanomyces euteiches]|nr:hypothetical protein AeNC1_000862 [Aphanomyces euteiches]